MDLVIDANILFAVCIKSGKTEELIFSEEIHLFALALKLNCPIWSNDKLLKNQNKIATISAVVSGEAEMVGGGRPKKNRNLIPACWILPV